MSILSRLLRWMNRRDLASVSARRYRPCVDGLEDRLVLHGLGTLIAVGQDVGGMVRVYEASTGRLLQNFQPFPGFLGAVRVAVGPVFTADDDLICAAGPGAPPAVKVFNGTDLRQTNSTLTQVASFFAFAQGFLGGLYVAPGNIVASMTNTRHEIIIGADAGAQPSVRVVNVQTGAPVDVVPPFFAFDEGFRGGVRVGSSNVNGMGLDEVVAGAGPGADPRVSIFGLNMAGTALQLTGSFLAYDASFRGGVYVSASRVLGAPFTTAQIITGNGSGGPNVRLFTFNFSTNSATLNSSFPGAAAGNGVRVGTYRVGMVWTILAATGSGTPGGVRGFNVSASTGVPTEVLFGGFTPFGAGYTSGLSISS